MNNFRISRSTKRYFFNLGLDRCVAKFVEQAGADLRYSRNCLSAPTVGNQKLYPSVSDRRQFWQQADGAQQAGSSTVRGFKPPALAKPRAPNNLHGRPHRRPLSRVAPV